MHIILRHARQRRYRGISNMIRLMLMLAADLHRSLAELLQMLDASYRRPALKLMPKFCHVYWHVTIGQVTLNKRAPIL